jgi:hypothetical protein
MLRIIEQTAICCGMVKTPNPARATKETAVLAKYHPHTPKTAHGSYPPDEAPDETHSQVEDAHSFACLRRLLCHPDLPGAFLLQRTTVYALVARFVEEGQREPLTIVSDAARSRCSTNRPTTNTSSDWSKRSRLPLMDGCARAGAASFWPWSCSRSEQPSWRAERRLAAHSIALVASALEEAASGSARERLPREQHQRKRERLEDVLSMRDGQDPFSRMRRGLRPIPK